MSLNESQRLDLVIAALATYSYSLEKAWSLRDQLAQAGLADPAKVVGKDEQAIGNELKAAGYDRGGITYIIAPRVITLMEAIDKGELDDLPVHIDRKDEEGFSSLLQSVKGVGPKAARLAWELMKNQ